MKRRVLQHPGRWIWLPVVVLAVIGLARLRFDAEIFDLLPTDLPVVQGLKLYQRYFANARDLMIALQGNDAEKVESAARAIADQLRPMTNLVSGVTWEAPWNEHPDQMGELLAYLWFNQPPDIFRSLTNRFEPSQLAAEFNEARDELSTALSPEEIARLSYDPLGLTVLPGNAGAAAPSMTQSGGMFSSPDGKFRVMYVRSASDLRSDSEWESWLDTVKPVADGAARPFGVQTGYTGHPAFLAEVGGGMRHDIIVSVGGTSAVIAILFWLAHRRVKPMLWLLALLALVLAGTLALGGLIYGTINVLSIGFAAILLGLAVDYAVVHYQEALAQPELSIPEIRREIAPSIFWAAVTTISAFLVLNFGGLPGLGQLGTLVGLGVALAATIMIFEYLPPLFPGRKEPQPAHAIPARAPATTPTKFRLRGTFLLTAMFIVFCAVVLPRYGPPPVDPTANALRPKNSPAYAAMDQITAHLNQAGQPLWLMVEGTTVNEVATRLGEIEPILSSAVSNKIIGSFTLPAAIWPQPEYQRANRSVAGELAGKADAFKSAGQAAGFAPRSLGLSLAMMDAWRSAASASGVFWPTNDLSHWIFDKATARASGHFLALGLVSASEDSPKLAGLVGQLHKVEGVHVSGWELLGSAIFSRVRDNMWKVVSPMVVLVLLSLWLAFRRMQEILLGVAVLVLSGFCLLAVMRLAGWSWNLMDMMAVPLVLGTGVDYGLFSQLALRRHNGDLSMAYRSVGRALLLCGGTAVAAFASLAFSENAGMASLGEVCAVGIAANAFVAVFLLPVWWVKLSGHLKRSPT